MDGKHYVYIHRDGLGRIFYVGKGTGKRAYEKHNRSVRWSRHANKHGFFVKILKNNMKECCAFSFEKALIASIGRKNLCNLTDGGEGTSGRIPSMEHRMKCSASNKGKKPAQHAIQAAVEKTRKKVGTTCGLVFESITEAARFVAINGNIKAAKSSISACCSGRRVHQCYGYEFRYIVDGKMIDSGFRIKKVGRPVRNNVGMNFETIVDAQEWLKLNGHPKALASNISQSCLKEKRNAYGYKWEYI